MPDGDHLQARRKWRAPLARDLRLSRNTVRMILRSGATTFEYERRVQPKLGLWRGELDRLLAANAARPNREREPRSAYPFRPGTPRMRC